MSNHRSRIIAFGLVALALVSTSVMPVTAQGPFPVFAPNRSSVDTVANVDQVIIRYRPTGGRIVPADVGQLRALSLTAGETLTYKREMSGERTHVLKLGRRVTSTEAEAITAKLATRPEIESAQPDYKRYPTLIPNDPLFAQQWDLGAPAAGIYGANLPAAWDLTTGAGSPVIAIIDTGYRPHADLVAHIIPGFDFISDAQVGNDGDGRDADPSDPGDWITAAESASGYFAGCPVSNSSWHGTHVAGTIGAVSNNNLGVTGINWNARIQPLRVLGKCGGYTSDIVDAIRWAAGIPVTGVPNNATPAKVINMSLGGSGACSAVEQAAVTDAVNAGTTVVVAAGNSNADASGFSPASCNGVISVAATGPTGNRAYYSNYGASVKIAAPGGDSSVGGTAGGVILSTLNDGLTTPGADSYAGYQGTSMATPHVVGVVSLMLAVNPSLKPAQVLQILQQSVTAFPAGSTCTTTTCGPGILNAAAAVAAAGALNPNPTATPTSTATSTPAPPTNTPPPQQPTSTSAPPTDTPMPGLTNTPPAPTDTPIPTVQPPPATKTPASPTRTPVPTIAAGSADLRITASGYFVGFSGAVLGASVRDLGPSVAASVVVTTVLPTNVRFGGVVTTRGSCTYDAVARKVTCTAASLPRNGTLSIAIRTTVLSGRAVTETFTVSSTTFDPALGNNSSTVTIRH